MNNKICNPELEVPKTPEMNDRDYTDAVLGSTKNMSNNLSIALNEMSNEKLFNDIYKIFEDTKKMSRDLYQLMFKLGWYTLEQAEENKVTQCYNELNQKYNEINI